MEERIEVQIIPAEPGTCEVLRDSDFPEKSSEAFFLGDKILAWHIRSVFKRSKDGVNHFFEVTPITYNGMADGDAIQHPDGSVEVFIKSAHKSLEDLNKYALANINAKKETKEDM